MEDLMDKFVVVKSSAESDDIDAEQFDDYDKAVEWMEETEDKAVIIKVQGGDFEIELEWHT
jgi:hypothetical protein